MLAATGYDMLKNAHAFASAEYGYIAIGFVTAFAIAYLSLGWLLEFVRTRGFASFGVYRIAVAVLFLLFVL